MKVHPAAGRAALVLALFALVAFRVWGFVPKDPKASADMLGFSVDRAAAHVARLAAAPRPPGTEGHDAAREMIRAELARLGIPVETQRATTIGTHWGVPYDGARVENLVARMEGRERGPALALVAHYDSVPNAPGAADDASGVAVLLETARALREGPALRNDVIFLFTDAEEAGVLGGNVFVREHPSFRDIGLALNFDARGSRGPVGLIETSAGAGALVRHFADAAPFPVASSLFPEVARRLGHQTDLYPFLQAGVPGMNFAFADGAAHYHAPVDDPAHLDRRTLAHAGTLALALARRFGDLDLKSLAAEPVVYFDVPGLGLVVYRRAWALPLAAIPLALFALVFIRAKRRGQARPIRVLAGLGALLAALGVAPALAIGIVAALRALSPAWGAFRGDPFDPGLARVALALLGVAAYAGMYRFFRARLSPFELALGAASAWLLLALVTAALLPGASFLFALPLAASLAGLLVWQGRPSPESTSNGLGLLLSALPALVLAVPVPYLLFIALGLPRAAPAVAVVVLLAGLLAPLLEVLGGGSSRKPALGLAGACLVTLGAAVATNHFSPPIPAPRASHTPSTPIAVRPCGRRRRTNPLPGRPCTSPNPRAARHASRSPARACSGTRPRRRRSTSRLLSSNRSATSSTMGSAPSAFAFVRPGTRRSSSSRSRRRPRSAAPRSTAAAWTSRAGFRGQTPSPGVLPSRVCPRRASKGRSTSRPARP